MNHEISKSHQAPATNFPSPLRTCVGCGAKRPQREMLRLAAQDGAPPVVDMTYRAVGRGAYLCRQQGCLEKAIKRHALERSLKLKQSIHPSFKEEIKQTFGLNGQAEELH